VSGRHVTLLSVHLRSALDLCTEAHQGDWLSLPGELPATAMLAGIVDVGGAEPKPAVLSGHTVAVYEPDARLSLVWPIPDRDEPGSGRRSLPDWAEHDEHEWKHALDGWVIVLLNGSPIWQARVWYLDWGAGIGGYVAALQPREGADSQWTASAWAVGLARLLNGLSGSADFHRFDPTGRLVPDPSPVHPLDSRPGDH
jgi:hypothetical protein